MKLVEILRGMPGSGKSHYAEFRMLEIGPTVQSSEVVSTDKFWKTSKAPNGFNYKQLIEAHEWCKARFVEALQNGTEFVILDNTNITWAEYKTFYVRIAESFGYRVRILDFNPAMASDAIVCARRNLHNVPLWKAMKMWEEFEEDPNTDEVKFKSGLSERQD